MPQQQEVHRGLMLITPYLRGDDVIALQYRINEVFKDFAIDRRILIDGEFGPATLTAARQAALLMGITGKARRKLKHGIVTEQSQKLIRGRKKTAREIARCAARKPYRKKLRERYDRSGGEKALAEAKRQKGVTEDPPGSNWGGMVQKFIIFCGYTFAVYWCGCFACWCAVKFGGAKIPNRIRLGFNGYIVADAQAHTNGLTAVGFSEARAGDIVTFTFPHIGLVDHVSGDTLYTIEGNTSSSNAGDQSNGGGVFARQRSRSDVACIARPDY